uniref:Yippee domain-containing protein n=1 Tax=Strongyloides stercoralis TaxID=6248 RepID=A0A0K0E2I4_STRER
MAVGQMKIKIPIGILKEAQSSQVKVSLSQVKCKSTDILLKYISFKVNIFYFFFRIMAAVPAVKVLHPINTEKKDKKLKTFQDYFPNGTKAYSCLHCRAHLAKHSELISKSFQGSQGKAYLFNSVVNIGCGPSEERVLLTGLHAVADIFCECCKTTLGWKYEHAFEASQKYKEGKFIIEVIHMVKDNGWEEGERDF